MEFFKNIGKKRLLDKAVYLALLASISLFLLMISINCGSSGGGGKTEKEPPSSIPIEYPADVSFTLAGQSGTDISVRAGVGTWVNLSIKLKEDLTLDVGDTIEVWLDHIMFIEIPPEGDTDGYLSLQISTDGNAVVTGEFSMPENEYFFPEIMSYRQIGTIWLQSGTLYAGDSITVLGYSVGTGFHFITSPISDVTGRLELYLDKADSDEKIQLAEPIKITTKAGRAASLYATAPSQVGVGESFDLVVRAEGMYHNIADEYTGTVTFDAPGVSGLPEEYTFTADDKGWRRFEGLSLSSEGVFRIEAADSVYDLSAQSNPIEASASAPAERIYWGDLHCHQYDAAEIPYLEPLWDPRLTYPKARDAYDIDFLAVTNHIVDTDPSTPEKWWILTQNAARDTYDPGKFVSFVGIEWLGPYPQGDHNVIFPDDTSDYFDPTIQDMDVIFDIAYEAGAVVIPHVGGTMANLDYQDDRVQNVVEISSEHGHFEWFGHNAISKGMRAGFLGSSDNHLGKCGGNFTPLPTAKPYPSDLLYRKGASNNSLAAIIAPELTREAILDAIRNRRTYATTGARILLDFKVNEEPMGSELSSDDYPNIAARVEGTGDIEVMEIIRNDETIYAEYGYDSSMEFTFTDTDPPVGSNAYYVRVTQVDEEMAWSSPIYVEQAYVEPTTFVTYPAWNWNRPLLPDIVDTVTALVYKDDLVDYLERVKGDRFIPYLMPRRVVHSMEGDYVVYTAWDDLNHVDVRIEFLLGMPFSVARINRGYLHYGQYDSR